MKTLSSVTVFLNIITSDDQDFSDLFQIKSQTCQIGILSIASDLIDVSSGDFDEGREALCVDPLTQTGVQSCRSRLLFCNRPRRDNSWSCASTRDSKTEPRLIKKWR